MATEKKGSAPADVQVDRVRLSLSAKEALTAISLIVSASLGAFGAVRSMAITQVPPAAHVTRQEFDALSRSVQETAAEWRADHDKLIRLGATIENLTVTVTDLNRTAQGLSARLPARRGRDGE